MDKQPRLLNENELSTVSGIDATLFATAQSPVSVEELLQLTNCLSTLFHSLQLSHHESDIAAASNTVLEVENLIQSYASDIDILKSVLSKVESFEGELDAEVDAFES
ncbi:hypothetical protein P9112_006519 [Eukaryota sp. TZLM1-RC]